MRVTVRDRGRTRRRRGFTLIEVLVATSLLGMTLLAVLGTFWGGFALRDRARARLDALREEQRLYDALRDDLRHLPAVSSQPDLEVSGGTLRLRRATSSGVQRVVYAQHAPETLHAAAPVEDANPPTVEAWRVSRLADRAAATSGTRGRRDEGAADEFLLPGRVQWVVLPCPEGMTAPAVAAAAADDPRLHTACGLGLRPAGDAGAPLAAAWWFAMPRRLQVEPEDAP